MRVARPDGTALWVDIDIVDDPRDRRRRLWCLTDSTDVHVLRDQLDGRGRRDGLVGQSDAMLDLRRRIADLCRVDATVLIEGETGTGKELVARALHDGSARAAKPFVPVNCGGLSETLIASQLFGHRRGSFTGAVADHKGFFETAHGGTIFLDEIGDVPPAVQVALLRVLQEREVLRVGDSVPRKVDVRVIAATNRNLQELVDKGQFRLDLLFRLRVARLALPPLRSRLGDIALLAASFLRDLRAAGATKVQSVSAEALRQLARYSWPGNVRELRAALEYATIHCRRTEIHTADLPPELLAGPAAQTDADDKFTATVLRDALRRAGDNRSRAAELLGISRATFYRRMSELGL